jgi:hypothetical protein
MNSVLLLQLLVMKLLFHTSSPNGTSAVSDENHSFTCSVAARSYDGFGHQLEGKCSCFLAAELYDHYHYVHIPFQTLAHIPHFTEAAQDFVVFRNSKDYDNKESNYLIEDHDPMILSDVLNGRKVCNSSVLHVVSNCWNILYKPPAVYRMESMKNMLHDMYLSSTKPNTGFSSSVYNIAVHFRRGDAGSRILGLR